MKLPEYKIVDFVREQNYFDRSQASTSVVCKAQKNDEKTTYNLKQSSCKGNAYSYVTTLNNWALYHAKQGNFFEASHLLKRSYGIRKAFWLYHPTTVVTLSNLALVYNFSGLLREAEITSLEAIDLMERTKSADYLHAALHFFALASLYKYQRRYKEEESSYRAILFVYESHYGANDAHVIGTKARLANCLTGQKKFSEAEQLYYDILAEACQRENNPIEDSSEAQGNVVLQTLEADKLWFKVSNILYPTVAETIKKLTDLYAYRDDYNLVL
ncbi:uncharacterized protein LOC119643571 [Glossina fuscipes]|uniref:Uncharacterized protein LOC119643571 n=1 Tax=Glossina fuscipes TaxID=7396 RepID=A0A9C5ZL96_9MUSC|nr:uncharacterized protein LOC119643571 [Glossina fuscipes]